ncbi:MAG: hypothetical protein L7F78_20770, partial [Syntrophales bacterium LBB04]|nr:hypothetical protein [Syntrophales bacterium LBB04]
MKDLEQALPCGDMLVVVDIDAHHPPFDFRGNRYYDPGDISVICAFMGERVDKAKGPVDTSY